MRHEEKQLKWLKSKGVEHVYRDGAFRQKKIKVEDLDAYELYLMYLKKRSNLFERALGEAESSKELMEKLDNDLF
jgi:hypothetical protein